MRKRTFYFICFWSIFLIPSSAPWEFKNAERKIDETVLLRGQNEPEKLKKESEIKITGSETLTFIDPSTFRQFLNLKKVNMDRNRIYDFPSDKPFLIHNRIDTYMCSQCSITRIFNHTFALLPELSMLYLSENKIDFISPFAFKNNSKLNFLDLQSNRLKFVNDQGYLHNLQNIGYLFLSGNNEFNFKDNRSLSARTDTLKVFKCDGCQIEYACVIIKSYPKIFELHLNDNQIGSFDCIEPKYAQEIRLSGNPIQHMKVSGMKLERFSCVGCSLESVGPDMFKAAPNLKNIDLSFNKIRTIAVDAFKPQTKLMDLTLDSNRIANFSQEFLESMPTLSSLCVDQNKLCPSYDNTQFKKLYIERGLRTTACSSKQHFEKSLPDIKSSNAKVLCERKTSLTRSTSQPYLDLSNQDIAYLTPDYLGSTEEIKILNLSLNSELHFYPEEPFLDNTFLEELDMTHCGVNQIYKETFIVLPNLKKIDLSHNRIQLIADFSFSNNSELEDLIFDYNMIRYLTPESLKSTPKLTRVSMNYNQDFNFEEDDIFLDHPVIQEFFCDNCGVLAVAKETFSKMSNLRKVVLSNNKIGSIASTAFDNNKNLKYLNFDGNELVSFDLRLITGLTELKILCLDQNEKFDYSGSKANIELRKHYLEKDLRSVTCAAEKEDDYFENRIKVPTKVMSAIFHPKVGLNKVPSKIEEIKAQPEQEVTEKDTEYEDRSIEFDNQINTEEPQSDQNTSENQIKKDSEVRIVKTGSFGGSGNSGSRITCFKIGSFFLIIVISLLF